MLYWPTVFGFVWLFGTRQGRRASDLDSMIRAICLTALLTAAVGALGGWGQARLVEGGFADATEGAFVGAKRAIWVGFALALVSVPWGRRSGPRGVEVEPRDPPSTPH